MSQVLDFPVRFCAACLYGFLLTACLNSTNGSNNTADNKGTILDSDGKPVVGVRVSLYPVNAVPGDSGSLTDPNIYTTLTDRHGRYGAKDIPTGEYNILASKDDASSFSDSVFIDSLQPELPIDTLRAPGSLSGKVRLQPFDDPRISIAQILGTNYFTNLDSAGNFNFTKLPLGAYRIRISVQSPLYIPTFLAVDVKGAESLQETVVPFYSGIPAVEGLEASPGKDGTVILKWNRPSYNNVQAYLIYRDSSSSPVSGTSVWARTTDTTFTDSVYSRTPRNGQYPWLGTTPANIRYRARILSATDSAGPFWGNVEVAVEPPLGYGTGTWKRVAENPAFPGKDWKSTDALVFRNRIFLIAKTGASGILSPSGSYLWSTPDGKTWDDTAYTDPIQGLYCDNRQAVVRRDSLWFYASCQVGKHIPNTLIAKSADGKSWIVDTLEFDGSSVITLETLQDKLWLIGDREAILYSEDGMSWTAVDPPSGIPDLLMAHATCVSDNKLWIFGGGDGDGGNLPSPTEAVMSSTDGKTWESHDVEFLLPRWYPSLEIHAGKIWFIGG